jgi:hypothetical protein
MDSKKYNGMDVREESISIAVINGAGKIVMECIIETKASMKHCLTENAKNPHRTRVFEWWGREGVGIFSSIENAQLIDFRIRSKRRKRRNCA